MSETIRNHRKLVESTLEYTIKLGYCGYGNTGGRSSRLHRWLTINHKWLNIAFQEGQTCACESSSTATRGEIAKFQGYGSLCLHDLYMGDFTADYSYEREAHIMDGAIPDDVNGESMLQLFLVSIGNKIRDPLPAETYKSRNENIELANRLRDIGCLE